MKKQSSQLKKEFYEEYWKQRTKEWQLHAQNKIPVAERISIAVNMVIKEYQSIKNKKITILDIGCGEGMLGKLLQETQKDTISITGCDISDTALQEASAHYSNVVQLDVEADALTQKFHQNQFDCIIILEVLEHLLKPANILKQCHTMLKEHGVLITSFPNIAWYRYRINLLKGRFPKNYLLFPGEHIQNFTFYSFTRLLRENKFSPIETDGQFIIPRFLRPARLYIPIAKKFPNVFGYQVVIKSKKHKRI